jgi:hypothetical protein
MAELMLSDREIDALLARSRRRGSELRAQREGTRGHLPRGKTSALVVLVTAVTLALGLAVVRANDRNAPPKSQATATYRGATLSFSYPAGWHVVVWQSYTSEGGTSIELWNRGRTPPALDATSPLGSGAVVALWAPHFPPNSLPPGLRGIFHRAADRDGLEEWTRVSNRSGCAPNATGAVQAVIGGPRLSYYTFAGCFDVTESKATEKQLLAIVASAYRSMAKQSRPAPPPVVSVVKGHTFVCQYELDPLPARTVSSITAAQALSAFPTGMLADPATAGRPTVEFVAVTDPGYGPIINGRVRPIYHHSPEWVVEYSEVELYRMGSAYVPGTSVPLPSTYIGTITALVSPTTGRSLDISTCS